MSKCKIFLCGYCKEIVGCLKQHIPDEIQGIIIAFSFLIPNPFGKEISDYDIEACYAALSSLSTDKNVTIDQFGSWIKDYLQLNWDELRIKRAWNELDQDEKKYITFNEFRNGLFSINTSDDIECFYSNLMVSTLFYNQSTFINSSC